MEGRSFGSFQKNQKNFKIPKVPKIVSKSVQTCFDYALGQFFRIFFAKCSMQGFSDFLDLRIWVQFSGPKNKSSVFRNITQQTFFLHSRHIQCTQSHFRFSGPKILSSDSRTEKFEISFPTQKSTDILIVLTPQSIYAIPFQIFRIYSHEFRFPNLKTWVRFSGLKFCGRDLKKFQVKSDEKFKVLKLCKIVPKCPNVFWGDFSEKCFLPSVQWSHPKISKKIKKK